VNSIRRKIMNEERKKILEMVAEKKITVDEAEKLFAAMGAPETDTAESSAAKLPWKYLRVTVEPGPNSENKEKVNIRVPMKLIRAGLKFAALIPKNAQGEVNKALQEKGIDIDLSRIKPEDLHDILSNLDDLTVDVDGKDKVRIFCE
jgi:hypothetical protein